MKKQLVIAAAAVMLSAGIVAGYKYVLYHDNA